MEGETAKSENSRGRRKRRAVIAIVSTVAVVAGGAATIVLFQQSPGSESRSTQWTRDDERKVLQSIEEYVESAGAKGAMLDGKGHRAFRGWADGIPGIMVIRTRNVRSEDGVRLYKVMMEARVGDDSLVAGTARRFDADLYVDVAERSNDGAKRGDLLRVRIQKSGLGVLSDPEVTHRDNAWVVHNRGDDRVAFILRHTLSAQGRLRDGYATRPGHGVTVVLADTARQGLKIASNLDAIGLEAAAMSLYDGTIVVEGRFLESAPDWIRQSVMEHEVAHSYSDAGRTWASGVVLEAIATSAESRSMMVPEDLTRLRQVINKGGVQRVRAILNYESNAEDDVLYPLAFAIARVVEANSVRGEGVWPRMVEHMGGNGYEFAYALDREASLTVDELAAEIVEYVNSSQAYSDFYSASV